MPAPDQARSARGADRPLAELPPPPAGDPLRRRGGAGGPSARAGRRPGGRGAHHGRGVPGGGEAHGRPRRPLAGVRARALGPPLEAARRGPFGCRGAASAGANGRRRRLRPCGGGGRRHQGAGALRDRPGRGRRLLRPQPEPLRAAPADRLLRLEAAARHPHHPLAGRWRSPWRPSSPTSIPSPRAAPPRCSRRCTCRSRSGWWSASRTRAAAGDRSPAAWTSSASRASWSSTTS